MARYDVRLLTSNGSKTLRVDATSVADAKRIASKSGRILGVKRIFSLDLAIGMTPSERYTFMVRLSSMVGSKVGTAEALRLIIATFSGNIRRAAQEMLNRIEDGMDIPRAMDADRKNFPVATTALVRAGAQGGETWKALKDAADFEYKLQTIRKGSMKEMAQAIFSFLIAGVLMIATTEYFGPYVMSNDMFASAQGVQVGWIEVTGKVLTYIMMVLLVIFGIMFWLGTVGRRITPTFADKMIMRVPYYKDLILARNNYVTLYKLGLLIGSGIRIEESLRLTAESSPRGALKDDLNNALKAVRIGRPWAAAMNTLHPTDRAALVSSTDRRDISRTLDMLARQYSDLYIQRMTSFAPFLQLIAALFMTLAGGVLFGLTILPMLQLAADMST